MSDQQLIDEVVGYLTKDGAVMDLSRARQGAKLIRRQHSRIEELENELMEQCRINGMGAERELAKIARIEADEALMRQLIRAWDGGSVTDLGTGITALRKRLESSNADQA